MQQINITQRDLEMGYLLLVPKPTAIEEKEIWGKKYKDGFYYSSRPDESIVYRSCNWGKIDKFYVLMSVYQRLEITQKWEHMSLEEKTEIFQSQMSKEQKWLEMEKKYRDSLKNLK